MAQKIGIDFGTTNSLISVILSGQAKSYLNDQRMPHSSVVSYSGDQLVVGTPAREQLEEHSGAVIEGIVTSPKTKLGKGVIFVQGRELEPSTVVKDLMLYLKEDALSQISTEDPDTDFSKAVVSIPVSMDGRSRKELRDALLQAGIHVLQFVHEPLAALYCYLKDKDDFQNELSRLQNKLVLVFDWGGGTLDLTLCLVTGQALTQVKNIGDNEVGGDYIDEAIRTFVLEKHIMAYSIQDRPKENDGAKAKLLRECEKAKIDLSEKEKVLVYLPDYFAVEEDYRDIEIYVTRQELNELSENFINRGLDSITDLLDTLNISQRRISLCLATGGMVNMRVIKARLLQLFSIDRLEISQKGDRIISEGCAWIANDELRISLAKPIEVQEARQSFYKVFKSGQSLPYEGNVLRRNFTMYCVDPRDEKAKFQIVRPELLNKHAAADRRITFDNLVVDVRRDEKPFLERLEMAFTIDDNLIMTIFAESALTQANDKCEVYDLEFSLSLQPINEDEEPEPDGFENELNELNELNDSDDEVTNMQVRSNVTSKYKYEDLVPGEFLYIYKPRALDPEQGSATKLQFDEHLYYIPCIKCKNAPCRCSRPESKSA